MDDYLRFYTFSCTDARVEHVWNDLEKFGYRNDFRCASELNHVDPITHQLLNDDSTTPKQTLLVLGDEDEGSSEWGSSLDELVVPLVDPSNVSIPPPPRPRPKPEAPVTEEEEEEETETKGREEEEEKKSSREEREKKEWKEKKRKEKIEEFDRRPVEKKSIISRREYVSNAWNNIIKVFSNAKDEGSPLKEFELFIEINGFLMKNSPNIVFKLLKSVVNELILPGSRCPHVYISFAELHRSPVFMLSLPTFSIPCRRGAYMWRYPLCTPAPPPSVGQRKALVFVHPRFSALCLFSLVFLQRLVFWRGNWLSVFHFVLCCFVRSSLSLSLSYLSL